MKVFLLVVLGLFFSAFGQNLQEQEDYTPKLKLKKHSAFKKHSHSKKADSCLVQLDASTNNIAPMYIERSILNGVYAGFNEIPKEKIILLFGTDKKQKAHRYNRTGTNGTYLYQDFVNVPFQAWNEDTTVQYHLAFRDFSSTGHWSLGPDHLYEYIWVAGEVYDGEASAELSSYNNQTAGAGAFSDNFMYFFHLRSNENVDSTNVPTASISTAEDKSPKIVLGSQYLRDFTQGHTLHQTIGTDQNSAIQVFGCDFPSIVINNAPVGVEIITDGNGMRLSWDTSAESALGDHIIELIASNQHGSDTLAINYGVIRGHTNNNVFLGIGGTGHFGRRPLTFFDFSREIFSAALYEGSIIVSNADDKVSGELYNQNAFTNISPVKEVTSNYDDFDYSLNARFNDQDNASGLGIEIELNSSSKSTDPHKDYILLDYTIKNTSSSALSDVFVGLSLDWDLLNITSNTTDLDSASQIAYVFDNSASGSSPYVGVKILSRNVSGFNAFSNGDEASAMHSIVMSQIGDGRVGGDIRHQLSTGPYNLAFNSSANVVFALISGNNLEDLRMNANFAQAVYNDQWAQNKYTHTTTNLSSQFVDNGMLNNTFSYKALGNAMASGTLFLSTSNTTHVGNIYDTNQFRPTGHFTNADEKYIGFETRRSVSFDDASAPSPLGVHVKQTSYSQNSDSLGNALIIDYEVTNTSGQALNDLLVTYFADFDIIDYNTNTTRYDSLGNFAIAFNEGNSEVFGIDIIKGGKSAFAAVPNGAIPNDIHDQLKNGTGELSNTDIRTLLSSAAFNLAANEKAEVSFVIAAADNLTELRELIARAKAATNNVVSDEQHLAEILPFLNETELNNFINSEYVSFNENNKIQRLDLSPIDLSEIPENINKLTELEEFIYYGGIELNLKQEAKSKQGKLNENGNLSRAKDYLLNYSTGPVATKKNVFNSKKGLSTISHIPASFLSIQSLKKVTLVYNNLSMSDLENLLNLPNIEHIDVFRNNISGEFPSNFSSASKLVFFNAAENYGIYGSIPASFDTQPNLKVFDIHGFNLSGSWPASHWDRAWDGVSISGWDDLDIHLPQNQAQWQNQSNILFMALAGTINGNLSSDISNLSSIERLHIVDNGNVGLNQVLPNEFWSLSTLKFIELRGNESMTGSIPSTISNLNQLEELTLSSNSMTGTIPVELYSNTNLRHLDLSFNYLTGDMANELGNLVNLIELNLYNNSFTGALNSSLWTLSNLEYLDLGNNQFHSGISSSISNLSNLSFLNLPGNLFGGELPSELWGLTKLYWLNVAGNFFTGEIPNSISNLTSLNTLWLSSNSFSGNFPESFWALPNLWQVSLSSTNLEVTIPNTVTNLSNMRGVYLSNITSVSGYENFENANFEFFSLLSSNYPEVVESFGTGLSTLYLSGFRIDSIPEAISSKFYLLSNLEVPVKKLSLNINQLTNLRNLYLNTGAISELSDEVNLANLSRIEASNGSLKTIPDSYLNLNLTLFNVNNNRIDFSKLSSEMQERFNSEAGWTIENQRLHDDQAILSTLLPFLSPEELENFLNSEYVAFDNDERIVYLDLSEYSLDSIPAEIAELVELREFIYYGNSNDQGKNNSIDAKQAYKGRNPYDKWNYLREPKSSSKKGSAAISKINSAFFDLPNLERVILVNNFLSNADLEGLLSLDKIKHIDVSGSFISGDFPSNFSSATLLESFNAGGNNISGSLPANFDSQPNLRSFSLHFNQLAGKWAASNWDRSWDHVSIHGNTADLEIELPANQSQWQNQANIRSFNLIGKISGQITADIAVMDSVEYLIIEDFDYFTGASGQLPSDVFSFVNLRELFIGGHPNLSGTVSNLGDLKHLRALGIYNNPNMSGSIPSNIASSTNLERVFLYNNGLSGTVPTNMTNLTRLTDFAAYSNNLSGQLPSNIGNLTELSYLDFEQNGLSGNIPSSIGNLRKLRTLWLNDNEFSGEIPSTIGSMTAIDRIYFQNNSLSGSLPSSIFNLNNVRFINFSNNQLSGTIGAIGNLTKLVYLNLSANKLSGLIPSSINLLQDLSYLDLNTNNFGGILPSGVWNMAKLRTANFHKNNLNITASPSLSNTPDLIYLYLSHNKSITVHNSAYELPLRGFSTTTASYPSEVETIGSTLERLHINGFEIDSIPQSLITASPNLKTLGISAKKMSSNVNALVMLENLYLHDGIALELSDKVSGLENLAKIEVLSAKLATVPDNYLNLPHTTFNVDSNRINDNKLSTAMKQRFASEEFWTKNGQKLVAIVSSPSVSEITPTSAKISLVVEHEESITLHYGLTTSYGGTMTVVSDSLAVFSLSGLTEQSTYHYKIVLNEGTLNEFSTSDASFTTTNSDNTAPSFTSSVQFSTEASLSHFISLIVSANEALAAKPTVSANGTNISASKISLIDSAEHMYKISYTAQSNGDVNFAISGEDMNGNIGSGTKTISFASLSGSNSKIEFADHISLASASRLKAPTAIVLEHLEKAEQDNSDFIQKSSALRIKRSAATSKLVLSVYLAELKGADKLFNHAFYAMNGEKWDYIGGRLNGNKLEYEFTKADAPIAVFWNKNQQLLPTKFTIEQNYPNPFNPSTTIRFAAPSAGKVQIRIYNSLGQQVRQLTRQQYDAGYHEVKWFGKNDLGQQLPSGIYFYQIITAKSVQTKKMVLIK